MQMENQPTTNRQWFRLASQARMELPPPMPPPEPAPAPAPAGPPPPRRGPPIRLASIALARSNLALETTTPAPAPAPEQTQPSPPPPPPVPAVAPPTSALLRAPTSIPAVEPMPPASVPSTTMTPPRTITPPTTITLLRTVTPPTVPAPPKTQTPPPAAEPSEGKFYEELTPAPVTEPPKPATLLPPTAAIVPPAQPPPPTRNSNGKPLKPTSDTVPVFLRPVATRAPTPPESPKVIKASSPTPPQSPRIKSQQSATNLPLAAQPKSIGLQDNPDGNYGLKSSAGGQGGELPKFIKQHAEARNAPSPPPKKEEKNATMLTGKAFATRKDDEKEMRIVTIAGENCGAIMDLGSGHQLNGRKQQVHDPKSHDGESRNMSNAMSTTKPMISLANSNVQCVNNSILFNASSVNRNPGVHINFTRRHREVQNTASSAPRGAHLSVD